MPGTAEQRNGSAWAPLVLALGLALLVPLPALRRSPPAPPSLLHDEAENGAAQPPGELPVEVYRPVARALLDGNLDAARSAVAEIAEALPEEAARARLTLALGELEHGRADAALLTLGDLEADVPGFEELRLVAWLRAAATLGDRVHVLAAGRRLSSHHAASPWTRHVSLQEAVRAERRGDAALARELLPTWRDEGQPNADAEALAFRLAVAAGERQAALDSGRWLLAESPREAASLDVAGQLFGAAAERLELWGLTPDQLLRRAERLLVEERGEDAGLALAAVPRAERGLRWSLLDARRLGLGGAADDALARLAEVTPQRGSELADVAALRADLLLGEARRRGGRQTLAQREGLRREARRQLLLAARWGGRSPVALRCWRRLYTELMRDEELEAALEALRALRRASPSDRSGVDDLFRRGWTAFERRHDDDAVATFATLEDLYPDTSEARWAKYWRARALLRLGQRERGTELLQEIAATPSGDFYRRHAAAWLGSPTVATAAPGEPVDWPVDPILGRARLLLDLGLVGMAQEELSLFRDRAAPRAAAALEAEILAASGALRASIRPLLVAFPELGTTRQEALPRRALELYYPLAHQQTVAAWATRHRLPLSLVLAIIRQESAFDLAATSHAGARGLMQLMPATARELARRQSLPWRSERLDDPAFSVRLGTAYFRQVLDAFDGDLELALAGYNCGPNRVRRWWARQRSGERDHFIEGFPLSETRSYVKRVILLADSYRRLYPDLAD